MVKYAGYFCENLKYHPFYSNITKIAISFPSALLMNKKLSFKAITSFCTEKTITTSKPDASCLIHVGFQTNQRESQKKKNILNPPILRFSNLVPLDFEFYS